MYTFLIKTETEQFTHQFLVENEQDAWTALDDYFPDQSKWEFVGILEDK